MTTATITPLPHVRCLWRPEQFQRVSNGTFETNTTGWAVTAGVNAAGTSITRITTDFYAGTACAEVVTAATGNSGCHFAFGSDTFFTEATYGTVYAAVVWLKRTSGGRRVALTLGSSGAVSDRASFEAELTDSWLPYRVLWMPSGNRTDVQLAITNGVSTIGGNIAVTTFKVDSVSVYQVDAFSQCENSNFPADTTGWDIGAGNIAVAATSLTQATGDGMDPATQTYATLITTSTSGSGADFPLGGRKFTQGRTYRLLCALKSVSGTTSARLRLGSIGTGADRGDTTSTTITTSWALYSVDWTPSADRTDACLAISNGAASVMTARIGFVEVYESLDEISAGGSNDLAAANWRRGDNFDSSSSSPGTIALVVRDVYTSSAATSHKFTPWNTAGPLSGSLEPGRRVWGRATYSGSIYPCFFGTIRQIVPRPYDGQADILAEDPLLDMSDAPLSQYFDATATYAGARGTAFGPTGSAWAGTLEPSRIATFGARRKALSSVTPENGHFWDATDGPVSMLGYMDSLNEATQSMHWVHPHAQTEYLWQYTTESRQSVSNAGTSDETFNDDFTMLTGLTVTDEQLENSQVVPWQAYDQILGPLPTVIGSITSQVIAAFDIRTYATNDPDDPYLHFTDDRYGSDDVPEATFRRETLKHFLHRKHYHPGKGRRFRTRGGSVYLNGSNVGKLRRGRQIYPGAFVPFIIPSGETRRVVIDFAVPMMGISVTLSWSGSGNAPGVVTTTTPHQLILDFYSRDGVADYVDGLSVVGIAYMPLDAEDITVVDHSSALDKGQHAGPAFSTPYIASRAQARGIGQYRNWRYGSARLRPRLETQNRFPTALQREVADHLTVTGGRFSISGKVFLVRGVEMGVAVGTGGLDWHHFMDLEEIPTAPGTWLVLDTHKPDGTKYLMA